MFDLGKRARDGWVIAITAGGKAAVRPLNVREKKQGAQAGRRRGEMSGKDKRRQR